MPSYAPPLMVCSLALHGAAAWAFWRGAAALPSAVNWPVQFSLMLCAATVFSLALLGAPSRRRVLAGLLFAARVSLVTVMSYPLGGAPELRLLLSAPLFVEAALAFAWPANALVCLGLLTGILYGMAQPVLAWTERIAAAEPAALAAAGGVFGLLAVAGCCWRRRLDDLAREREMSSRLAESVDRLTGANMEFQRFAVDAEEASTLKERKRVSREIHDTTGHAMTNIIMMAEAAMALIDADAPKAAGVLSTIKQQAQSGLNETRRALRELRMIDDRRPTGLRALNHMVRTFARATGVKVVLNYANLPWSLGERVDETIYRFVQEGLTNAFRHGRADRIVVSFWREEHGLQCRIHDNGRGSQHVSEGIGISGMRERIAELEGRLEADNVADGFQLAAWMPLKTED